jgi:ribosomal protein S18 acetylase RimI-like enzyme
MSGAVDVRCADMGEARLVAAVLAVSFTDDPVSCWLFPDPRDRGRRHSAFFRVYVEHAIRHGVAHIAGDFEGVALWHFVDPDRPGSAPAEELLLDACGPNYHRFVSLDQALREAHPESRMHTYLPFIGVLPACRGKGLGGALLDRRLSQVDGMNIPAYVEASSERSTSLYERFGFRRLPPLRAARPGGPRLYPMWRPVPPDGGDCRGRTTPP